MSIILAEPYDSLVDSSGYESNAFLDRLRSSVVQYERTALKLVQMKVAPS